MWNIKRIGKLNLSLPGLAEETTLSSASSWADFDSPLLACGSRWLYRCISLIRRFRGLYCSVFSAFSASGPYSLGRGRIVDSWGARVWERERARVLLPKGVLEDVVRRRSRSFESKPQETCRPLPKVIWNCIVVRYMNLGNSSDQMRSELGCPS